jgi:flagellar biosynthesis/type III secretory pathway protein FliH
MSRNEQRNEGKKQRNEGREEGQNEGRDEGRNKVRKEGTKEGTKEGRAEGRNVPTSGAQQKSRVTQLRTRFSWSGQCVTCSGDITSSHTHDGVG